MASKDGGHRDAQAVHEPDLTIRWAGLTFANPIMPASGCFNCGQEFVHAFDVGQLGAIINKTVMPKPRAGNPPERVAETRAGMINSIGIPGKGPAAFLKERLPFMRSLGTRVIVSIGGNDGRDFAELAALMDDQPGIDALELDLSCPNLEDGAPPAVSADATYAVVRGVRAHTAKPLVAKLSPMVTDLTSIAAAAMDGGADALCVANTYPALALDIETQRPILGTVAGGLSGPAIKAMTLRWVWELTAALGAPIIACGGVQTADDAVEYLLAGARMVQVGTANFYNPHAMPEIIQGLRAYLTRKQHRSVEEVIGLAHRNAAVERRQARAG